MNQVPRRGDSEGEIRLIVTADDFGAAVEVNEAVERGHREGILTAASLMVSGAAATDAVERAKAMPGLGVGLHVVLADGRPVLPPEQVPALVGPDGRFHDSMIRTAVTIAVSPPARAQMRAEVEAQFAAFAATGLPLDHVNAHKHFHLHPMIASAILQAGRRHGMRAIRVPTEPGANPAHNWWASLMGKRLRQVGLLVNDRVAGLRDSGAFDADRMAQAIAALRPGLTELYCHPATGGGWPGSAPGYRYRDELDALTDPSLRQAVLISGARTGSFAAMAG